MFLSLITYRIRQTGPNIPSRDDINVGKLPTPILKSQDNSRVAKSLFWYALRHSSDNKNWPESAGRACTTHIGSIIRMWANCTHQFENHMAEVESPYQKRDNGTVSKVRVLNFRHLPPICDWWMSLPNYGNVGKLPTRILKSHEETWFSISVFW